MPVSQPKLRDSHTETHPTTILPVLLFMEMSLLCPSRASRYFQEQKCPRQHPLLDLASSDLPLEPLEYIPDQPQSRGALPHSLYRTDHFTPPSHGFTPSRWRTLLTGLLVIVPERQESSTRRSREQGPPFQLPIPRTTRTNEQTRPRATPGFPHPSCLG